MIVRSHLFWNLFICYLLRSYIYAKNKRGVLTVPAFIKLYLDYFFTYEKNETFILMFFYIFRTVQSRIRNVEPAHTKKTLSRPCSFL